MKPSQSVHLAHRLRPGIVVLNAGQPSHSCARYDGVAPTSCIFCHDGTSHPSRLYDIMARSVHADQAHLKSSPQRSSFEHPLLAVADPQRQSSAYENAYLTAQLPSAIGGIAANGDRLPKAKNALLENQNQSKVSYVNKASHSTSCKRIDHSCVW